MPVPPHQLVIGTVQLLMLAVGAWVVVRALFVPELRTALLGRNRLAPWPLTGHEVTFLALVIFLCGLVGQIAATQLFSGRLVGAADEAGLRVVVFGFAFHAAALLGWPLFQATRTRLHRDYGAEPPAAAAPRRLGVRSVVWNSVTTLVLALPLLALCSLGWTFLLRRLGLPHEPQDLIAVFGAVQSPAVLLALIAVACIAAPINEELLFRGVVYRGIRQRFGRAPALVVSGLLFGLLHANWAGFLPLALLGAILALAYEHSGDIRVPIVAHALFNLNTTVVVLSGLPQA
jgi:membrane protease YdiL (CAAX protease family)